MSGRGRGLGWALLALVGVGTLGCGPDAAGLRLEGAAAIVMPANTTAGRSLLRVSGRVSGMRATTEDREHRLDCVVQLVVVDAAGNQVPELAMPELVRFEGVTGVLSRSELYDEAPFSAELLLPASLPPGRYALRLRAIDALARTEADARVEVSLP